MTNESNTENNDPHHPRTGFIGAGNMATSLLGGLIDNGWARETLRASDPDHDKRQALSDKLGIHTDPDNEALIAWADIVVLAVKPQILRRVVQSLAGALADRQPLVISIAAGVRSGDILAWADCPLPLIRVMPNTPALVKTGMSGLFAAPGVSRSGCDNAEKILAAVGETLWLENESDLDVVTALSGSGPAYFFFFMEALQAAGESLGLPPDKARQLTLQTALGASRMAHDTSNDPATLRNRVTSPGGTTERGLAALEEGGLQKLVHQAVKDAAHRASELGESLAREA